MNCKIIALRPLKGCNENFLKVLKPDITYYFYSDYKIDRKTISYNPSMPDDFFGAGKPSISISAVVGKNGSGKSSLIELLVACVNNIARRFEINTDVEIEVIDDLHVELYFESDAYYKIVLNRSIAIYKQLKSSDRFSKIDLIDFKSKNFFYSIIVNYSHYGLNAREVGGWINSLFHKNDGYQTPIVLSPMRTDGNIDINNERGLTESRLMANIIRPAVVDGNNEVFVTENAIASKIRLELIQGSNQVIYKRRVTSKDFDKTDHRTGLGKGSYEEIRITDLPDIHDELLREIDKIFPFGFKGHWETGNHIETLAHHYIIRKIIKIAVTYPFYYQYFDQDEKKFKDGKLRGYLDLIFNKNENHISVKLKQTLNFLKYRHIDVYSHKPFELDVQEFARKVEEVIKQSKLRGEAAIELLPPPIFSRKIILRSVSEREKEIEFYKLSSGEKQLIFSVNTILYHLLNLDSIKNHRFQKGYRFVNIMLDEIELYFHPDRQKEYVSFLLRRIGELKFKTIQAINICFVTHSPFILSDIPSANILFLDENGMPKADAVVSRTFGANIHDLLKNNFFLLHGSMGNFAKEKINDTINFLNHQKVLKEIVIIKRQKQQNKGLLALKLKEEKELKAGLIETNLNKHRDTINLIGEPIVQIKLAEMFDEVTNGNLELNIIRQRIAALQEEEKRFVKK